MPDHPVVIKKKQSAHAYMFFYVLVWLFMASVMVWLAVDLAAGISAGSAYAIWSNALLLILSVYMFTANLISIPLNLHLNYYYGRGRYPQVALVHKRVLKLLERLPVYKGANLATIYSNIGVMQLAQGYTDSAETMFHRAAAVIEKSRRLKSTAMALVIYHNLAAVYIRQKKFDVAQRYAGKAQEIADKLKRNKILKAMPLAVSAALKLRLDQLEEAQTDYLKGLKVLESERPTVALIPGSMLKALVHTHIGLAIIAAKRNRLDESQRHFNQVLEYYDQASDSINTMAIESLNLLADEYTFQGSSAYAEKVLELAYCLGRDYPFHPDAQTTLRLYEHLLSSTGRQSEVADLRSWLRHVEPPRLTAN
jgi:tetratricopeptide (TPR) repeat protein